MRRGIPARTSRCRMVLYFISHLIANIINEPMFVGSKNVTRFNRRAASRWMGLATSGRLAWFCTRW